MKQNNSFYIIWLGLLFEVIILSLLKSYTFINESIIIVTVSLHIIFTTIVIINSKLKSKIVFISAFYIRLMLMFWDIYRNSVFKLPNSGSDSEVFYYYSLKVMDNLSLVWGDIFGGMYSKMNGVIFSFIGPQRMVGQYINVLLGLSIIIIIYKILVLLEISPHISRMVILVSAFFPNSLILSAIFLREIIITFFVVCSLYFFILWFKKGKTVNIITSFLLIGLASTFHSGVIGVLVGYSFVLLFYKQERDAYKFTLNTIIVFVLIAILTSIIYTQFRGIFLEKFLTVEDINDIYSTANTRLGGSAYLKGVEINNPLQLIIYGPIKTFYFLTAPLPWDWRWIMDVITFFTDSILYLVVIIITIANFNRIKEHRTLIISLLLILACVSLIFGIGVGNAGTAVRHRHKILPIFLIIFAIVINSITEKTKKIQKEVKKDLSK